MLASSPLNDDHNVIREPDEARLVPAITLRLAAGHSMPAGAAVEGSRFVASDRWLPGRVSNPRLPVNGRTSCRSTTWHREYRDGESNPALRVEGPVS